MLYSGPFNKNNDVIFECDMVDQVPILMIS